MGLIFQKPFLLAANSLSLLIFLGGCGGGESSTTADAPATASAPVAPASQTETVGQASDSSESEDSGAEKSLVTYGGEDTSDSQSGFSGGGFQGAGADDEDDGSGTFGGPGFSPAPAGRGPGGGGPSIAGRSSPSGGPGGPPAGSRGPPPSATQGGPGGQFFGAGSEGFPDSEDADFGLDAPGFPGPGGRGADSTQMLTGFVQQYCISCHSANNPKGEFRLDQISDQVESQAQVWKSVLGVLEDGSMPPRQSGQFGQPRQPDESIRQQVIDFIRSKLGPDAQATFLQQAEKAFQKGDSEEALRLFYAHTLVVDDTQAAELLDHIRLYRPKVAKPEDLIANNESAVTVKPGLKTQLKLAVGIILKADSNVTDVKPIGTRQGAGGGSMGDAGDLGLGRLGGRGDSSTATDDSKLKAFEDLTGDYGKELVSAFLSRRNDGKYGTLFSTLKIDPTSPDVEAGPAVAGAGGPDADFGLGESGDDFGGSLDLGGGAAPSRGPPGRGVPGGFAPGGGGLGGMGLGGADNQPSTRTLPGQNLANGLVYLGKGTINELLKKAADSGSDGLFVFDISSNKNNRSNRVTTDTRLRFLLASGKVVVTSPRTLNNWEIERAAAQNKEADDVQKQVDAVFARLDEVLSVDSIPQMSETAALKHLHGQLHAGESSLQIMAQARLFQSKGIISPEQLAMIYQIVLEGNEGLSLATGSEADKKLVLETVMPQL